jgi:hypothetical protein
MTSLDSHWHCNQHRLLADPVHREHDSYDRTHDMMTLLMCNFLLSSDHALEV